MNKPHHTSTEIDVDNIKRVSHWVFSIAPFLASTVGFILRKNHYVIEFIIIGTAVFTNFVIFFLSSKREERRALEMFLAFITNRLPPPRRPGELTSHTDVAILEAKKKPYFKAAVWQKFQTKPAKGDTAREEDIDERLNFTLIECDSVRVIEATQDSEKDNHTATESAALTESKKKELFKNMTLAKAEAVVVMRSRHLEQCDWVYKCVDEWARKNPEVPVLFVRPKRRTKYKANALEDNFFWIPNDPRSLPWRLLKRAKDRADEWYVQARYNSALLTNILFLVLMIMSIAGFWVGTKMSNLETDSATQTTELKTTHEQEKSNLEAAHILEKSERDKIIKNNFGRSDAVVDGLNAALRLKQNYETEILKKSEPTLSVSYWFSYRGKPYAFVTTETLNTRNWYPKDKTSLIGCGFVKPSRVVTWEGNDVHVFANGQEQPNHGCAMRELPQNEKIPSIACSTYRPSGNDNPNSTVGVCIFARAESSILIGNYLAALQRAASDFYQSFNGRIDSKEVTALAERKPTPPPFRRVNSKV